MLFAVDVCELPETGGSTFVLVAGLFVLVVGVIVTRWVRQSAGRLSVVVAPLVLLGGLVLAPAVVDPCATTTTVAATTTTVAATTTTVAATTTTVAATTTTTPAPLYSVGDTGPGGGIVFYVDETRPEGSRYFEAAPLGAEAQRTWATEANQSALVTGADGTAIGSGEDNTADIVAQSGNVAASSAAAYASDYAVNGFTDWFLPSKDELNKMYTNLYLASPPLGGFSAGSTWSSSEYGIDDTAWFQSFYDGVQGGSYKGDTYFVRPVRAF